jgi:hypothetical protein
MRLNGRPRVKVSEGEMLGCRITAAETEGQVRWFGTGSEWRGGPADVDDRWSRWLREEATTEAGGDLEEHHGNGGGKRGRRG